LHLTSNLTDSGSLHAPIVLCTTVMGKGQFRKEWPVPDSGENGPRRHTYEEVSRWRRGSSRLSDSP